jgi:hypothetical protein
MPLSSAAFGTFWRRPVIPKITNGGIFNATASGTFK